MEKGTGRQWGVGKIRLGKLHCFEMAEAKRHGSDQGRGGTCEYSQLPLLRTPSGPQVSVLDIECA